MPLFSMLLAAEKKLPRSEPKPRRFASNASRCRLGSIAAARRPCGARELSLCSGHYPRIASLRMAMKNEVESKAAPRKINRESIGSHREMLGSVAKALSDWPGLR